MSKCLRFDLTNRHKINETYKLIIRIFTYINQSKNQIMKAQKMKFDYDHNINDFIKPNKPIYDINELLALLYQSLIMQFENINNEDQIYELQSSIASLNMPFDPIFDNDLAPMIKYHNPNFDHANFIFNYYELYKIA